MAAYEGLKLAIHGIDCLLNPPDLEPRTSPSREGGSALEGVLAPGEGCIPMDKQLADNCDALLADLDAHGTDGCKVTTETVKPK